MRKAPRSRQQKRGEGIHRIERMERSQTNRQTALDHLDLAHPPQKLEKRHQPAKRPGGSRCVAQFQFLSVPESSNLQMHCFVLLGVSSIQLKLNRVAAKQCSPISEFRIKFQGG